MYVVIYLKNVLNNVNWFWQAVPRRTELAWEPIDQLSIIFKNLIRAFYNFDNIKCLQSL